MHMVGPSQDVKGIGRRKMQAGSTHKLPVAADPRASQVYTRRGTSFHERY